jgi:DNA polymerase III delta subunit
MLKLIHGENYYLSHKRLLELKNTSDQVEYAIIDGDTINDPAEIFVSEQSFGMFKTSTLTIIKRFFKNPKRVSLEKKIIEKLEKSDISAIELIFWEDVDIYAKKRKGKSKASKTATGVGSDGGMAIAKKPRATSKLDTYLKNNAQVEDNKNLSMSQTEEWIKDVLGKYGISASTQVVKLIIERAGINLSLLDEELNKLSLYLNAEGRKELKPEDVESVVCFYQKDFQVWDLTDAFFNKDQKKALEILDVLLVNPQQDFPMIIGAILKQIKTIYLVKKYRDNPREAMSKLELMPFLYYKAENLARRISVDMLRMMYRKFIDLDYSIKQGKIDVKLGLDLLILTLSR